MSTPQPTGNAVSAERGWILPIPFAPDYGVGEDGRVFSLTFRNGTARHKRFRPLRMKVFVQRRRNYVSLRYNGKSHRHLVHRLVAATFIPNPENKPEVNHIDGNSLNDRASNLEWTTRKENRDHATVTLGSYRGENNPQAVLDDSTVRSIRRRHEAGESTRRIARSLGMSATTIWQVVARKAWRHVA